MLLCYMTFTETCVRLLFVWVCADNADARICVKAKGQFGECVCVGLERPHSLRVVCAWRPAANENAAEGNLTLQKH